MDAHVAERHSSIDAAPWIRNVARASVALATASVHVGAVLLIAEVILLSAAVFFRYVMHSPLIWSDELAEMILVWQAMLGAVAAFHNHQHLKLDLLARLLPPIGRGYLDTMCLIIVALLSAVLAFYAFEEAEASLGLRTPALNITPAWRMAAIVVGLGLISLLAFGSLISRIHGQTFLPTAAAAMTVSGIVGVGIFLGDSFQDLGDYNVLIFFLGLGGACIAIGLPIAFCFALAASAYVLFATSAPLDIVVAKMETGMAHILLLSAPLFITLGSMLVISGMADNLVRLLVALVGHARGGLSYVLVAGMALVSGISGSKAADMAAIAPVLVPEMRSRGARDGEIVGLMAASCAMSETIPPSLILIMTGAVTGVSIGALFAVGWYPAVALAVILCVMARLRGDKLGVSSERVNGREVRKLAVVAVPVLILPFIIRAAVVEGVATATEVATVGIAYVLLLTLMIERRFDWKRLYLAMQDASALTGVIFLILATANAMAWGFVQSGFSMLLGDFAENLPGGAYGFLIVSILLFIVLGSILEGIPAIVLVGPLLFPVAGNMGISEVHFALVAVLSMGLGLFAPPFGVGFYTACAICGVQPTSVMKSIWPYMAAILAGIVLVAVGPIIAAQFM